MSWARESVRECGNLHKFVAAMHLVKVISLFNSPTLLWKSTEKSVQNHNKLSSCSWMNPTKNDHENERKRLKFTGIYNKSRKRQLKLMLSLLHNLIPKLLISQLSHVHKIRFFLMCAYLREQLHLRKQYLRESCCI